MCVGELELFVIPGIESIFESGSQIRQSHFLLFFLQESFNDGIYSPVLKKHGNGYWELVFRSPAELVKVYPVAMSGLSE